MAVLPSRFRMLPSTETGPRGGRLALARVVKNGLQRPKLLHVVQLPSTITRAWASTTVPLGVSAFQLMIRRVNAGKETGWLV